jgi:hypothetical protein
MEHRFDEQLRSEFRFTCALLRAQSLDVVRAIKEGNRFQTVNPHRSGTDKNSTKLPVGALTSKDVETAAKAHIRSVNESACHGHFENAYQVS